MPRLDGQSRLDDLMAQLDVATPSRGHMPASLGWLENPRIRVEKYGLEAIEIKK